MGQIRIALFDWDQEYVERLARLLESGGGDRFSIVQVADRETLDHMISMGEADAVLIPDELEEDYPTFIGNIRVGYLTGKRSERTGCIFRYQAAQAILSELDALLEVADNTVKTLFFMGAVPGAGTSAIAAATATYLAEQGKPVLYMNLDVMGDENCVFTKQGSTGTEKLLSLIMERGTTEEDLMAAIGSDAAGVDHIGDPCAPLCLPYVPADDMTGFLETVQRSKKYRYIILDSAFEANGAVMAALSAATNIMIVTDAGTVSCGRTAKILAYLKRLEDSGMGQICSKTGVVCNRYDQADCQANTFEGARIVGRIAALADDTTENIVAKLAEDSAVRALIMQNGAKAWIE